MIKGALNFRIFVGISSYSYEFLVFRDLIILSISNQLNSRKCAVRIVNQVNGRIHIIPRITVTFFDAADNSVCNS